MAQQVEGYHPTLLIDGDGNFNSKFVDDLKLAAVSRPVAVVSVFGVQSTGKSTLMNSLHSTKFKVMDASQGMHQTTKGIWVAKCPLPNPNGGPEILAVDTEGSDGSEREDDTKFEKQTALFCLAVSNTVIVNMMCCTIGLNNGGNRPLLRTVFDVVGPTYHFVVKHMRLGILEKFEQAAVDEVRKNGALVAIKTHKYISEFKNQLKDVAVKQANWNQDTEQLVKLESEMARAICGIRAANEAREQRKKDKREFALNVVKIVASTAGPVVSSAIMAARKT